MSGLAGSVVEGVEVAHHALMGLLAQSAPAASPGAGMGSTILFILLMLGVFWFVMWRPQSKQMKAHQAMLAALKKGDEVVLLNGILGKVHEVGEKLIVLEVARDVRIRVVPSAITAKVPTGALEASGGEDGNNK